MARFSPWGLFIRGLIAAMPAGLVAFIGWSFTLGAFPIAKGGLIRCSIIPAMIAHVIAFALLLLVPESKRLDSRERRENETAKHRPERLKHIQ